jgi:hypothetical protein
MSKTRKLLAIAYGLVGHALPVNLQSEIKEELAKPAKVLLSNSEIVGKFTRNGVTEFRPSVEAQFMAGFRAAERFYEVGEQ